MAASGYTHRCAGLRAAALLCALLSAPSCEARTPEDAGVQVSVRDSAGITIVEHTSVAVPDDGTWLVDFESAVRIGRVEGDPDYLFGRIAGFVRLGDGRIAVADAMGPLIRIYRDDGTYDGRIGGPGSGPGEFTNLVALVPYVSDSLLVVDYEGGRWTVLDPEGAFVRTVRPTVQGWSTPFSSPTLYGFFADGTALLGEFRRGEQEADPRPGEAVLQEDSVRFFQVDSSGDVLADFGTLVSGRSVSTRIDGRQYSWDGFRPRVFRAVHGERFYYADAASFEVRVFRSGGRLERIIRVHEEPRSPPAIPSDRLPESPQFRELFRVTPQPERVPSFSDLLLDTEGNLWIREWVSSYTPPAEVRWFVFDSDGMLQRVVRLRAGVRSQPYRLSPPSRLVVGADYALTFAPSSLGVETLALAPLRKN